MQQLIKRHRIDPQNRGALVNQAFADHFHRHPQRGLGGALARAGLQHPQLPAFDGKFDVLHVAVMPFQQVEHRRKFSVSGGHCLFHAQRLGPGGGARGAGQVLRGADPRDHVLALGIDQPFAVIRPLTGGGIAGEGHAGGAGFAHIAEDHRLHVDGSAPVPRDVVEPAIDLGAVCIPAVKHRPDRTPQLFVNILRKVRAQFSGNDLLVFPHQRLPVFRAHLHIGVEAVVFLDDLQRVFEQVMIDAQHHIAVHLDEPAIAVPGKARIAGTVRQTCHSCVIQPEIKDGIHHPRHRYPRAGADRDQQRISRIAEALAHGGFNMRQRGRDFGLHRFREITPISQIAHAFFGGDGEARRHRQADARHLRQIGALAANDRLVARTRVWAAGCAAKGINALGHAALFAQDCREVDSRIALWRTNCVLRCTNHARLRQELACEETPACKWWALTGSNRRPSRCKRDALPTELSARTNRRHAHSVLSGAVNQLIVT